MSEIYQPAEDSFLMSRILKENLPKLLEENPDLKLLEIGAGSGIHLETAKSLEVKNIFSSDVNPKSVNHCNLLGFNCIHSDLFEKIKGKFDLIIFNPPYLSEDKQEPKDSRLATTGGKKGSGIINRFLKQAKNHLNKNGKIFLIASSLTKGINFLNYNKKLLGKEKLFFEEIYVWEITA